MITSLFITIGFLACTKTHDCEWTTVEVNRAPMCTNCTMPPINKNWCEKEAWILIIDDREVPKRDVPKLVHKKYNRWGMPMWYDPDSFQCWPINKGAQ